MRDKCLAQKYINAGRVGDDKFYELLKVILSYRADAKDDEIKHSLLKKLILDLDKPELANVVAFEVPTNNIDKMH